MESVRPGVTCAMDMTGFDSPFDRRMYPPFCTVRDSAVSKSSYSLGQTAKGPHTCGPSTNLYYRLDAVKSEMVLQENLASESRQWKSRRAAIRPREARFYSWAEGRDYSHSLFVFRPSQVYYCACHGDYLSAMRCRVRCDVVRVRTPGPLRLRCRDSLSGHRPPQWPCHGRSDSTTQPEGPRGDRTYAQD